MYIFHVPAKSHLVKNRSRFFVPPPLHTHTAVYFPFYLFSSLFNLFPPIFSVFPLFFLWKCAIASFCFEIFPLKITKPSVGGMNWINTEKRTSNLQICVILPFSPPPSPSPLIATSIFAASPPLYIPIPLIENWIFCPLPYIRYPWVPNIRGVQYTRGGGGKKFNWL